MAHLARHLDAPFLAHLAGLTDPIGVLTVLATPDDASAHEIRTVLHRHRRDLPIPENLVEEAAAITDNRQRGLAHGFVACIGGGDRFHFTLPARVATVITIGGSAELVDIARAVDAGRALGLIDVGLEGIRTVECADGTATELAPITLATRGDWHEMRGPARAQPQRSYESSSQRDQYERRVEAHRSREVADAARAIGDTARRRGWHGVLVGGDPRHARQLAGAVTGSFVLERHLPPWRSAAAVAIDVAPELAAVRHAEAARLIEAARARPAGFARGRRPVLAALTAGRATRVIVDGEALADHLDEVVRAALAERATVHFADGELGDLDAVVCELHGSAL